MGTEQKGPPSPRSGGPARRKRPQPSRERVRAWLALIACSLLTVVAMAMWSYSGQVFLLGWALGSTLLALLVLRQL